MEMIRAAVALLAHGLPRSCADGARHGADGDTITGTGREAAAEP
jgi:hypothetical protein